MLRHLSIRDFVIVAALDLEFDGGFTVFSGETGAGKSILIDALALALGERADASVVRAGCGRADITAEFTPHDRVARWLDEHAFDAEDTVMLRRVIDANGRSRAFINGTSATLAQLRELGEMLVDIHGQHAHQLLMRPDAQRELFDTHAGLAADAANVARAWRVWRDATQAIDAAKAHERELQLEREKLAWQLAELDKLAPQPGEWDEVGHEHKRLSHSANLIAGVQGALNALSEADGAMLPQLGAIVSKLRGLADYDSGLADALASLEPAEIQLQEAVYSLSHYAQRLDRSGPARAGRSAPRAALDRPEVPAAARHAARGHAARRAQLAALDAAADLGALEAAQSKAWDAYLADAKRLSKARAGGEGARRRGHGRHAGIVDGGRQLRSRARAAGRRRPARARTGRIPRRRPSRRAAAAAREVASGGELARISLALAVIASAASPTPTLIFDEVDTGIGGGVAEVVGRLLHQLGRNRQVLCVTHLPQVAARGDHHFQVAKGADERGGTVSSVIALDKASRVEEVARMLGGLEITATTRKHAKEMLAA
jgi:DNA repair protein RecN (Recombination protein N)